jgi:hypothetical protein
LCNIEPLPVQVGLCLYSVYSKCTIICLDRCDENVSGVCEVYRVERNVVLYCTLKGSTVCFTIDRILSGLHRWLNTKGTKISASHQGMKRVYRLNGSAYLEFIRRQRSDQSTSWALHVCCDKKKFSKYGSCG